jgi:hypothetical protein
MSDEFDATPYVRPPILDVPTGVALGVALLTAAPKKPPDNVRKAARRLRTSTLALQRAWADSDAQAPPPDRRKADMRVDNAWGALFDRLEAFGRLPDASVPDAARARELLASVCGPDREWLKLRYNAEWAESDKRLRKIHEDDHLSREIDRLAGPEFLTEVRAAHAVYGAALGVTEPGQAPSSADLAGPLRVQSRAVARYALAVAAMAGDEDSDSLAAVRVALLPIDEHREAFSRRSAAGEPAGAGPTAPPATPTTPVPDVH